MSEFENSADLFFVTESSKIIKKSIGIQGTILEFFLDKKIEEESNLFVKDISIPIPVLQTEALEGRIDANHPSMPEIKTKIKILRSGYNGEKELNYHLNLLQPHKFRIFHDVRLPYRDSYFQIDALLLSPKILLTLEGKNHKGLLRIEKKQMIHEYLDMRDIQENPITQASRHNFLLQFFFDQYNIPQIPFEYLVAICRNSTEIVIEPGYTEAEQKVYRASDLINQIIRLESQYKDDFFIPEMIDHVSNLLIKSHTPQKLEVLTEFKVEHSEIIPGCRCEVCNHMPMKYVRNRWECPVCNAISDDAHIFAINDYFLIYNKPLTNKELRDFLQIPSTRVATFIFTQMNLPFTGGRKYRLYKEPLIFPITSNNVSPKKSKTKINEPRGNVDEENIVLT